MSADLLLVASSGGHLAQLHALGSWWRRYERAWVTFKKPDAVSLLRGERVHFARFPTNRHLPNLILNFAVAWRVLRAERPRVIVSSGAGVAIPFFVLGRALGARLVYLEPYDRLDAPTLTGRLLYPLADKFLIQWAEQRRFYPRAELWGRAL